MKYLRACFLFKKALGYFFSLAILMSLVQSSVSKLWMLYCCVFNLTDTLSPGMKVPISCTVTFGMVDLGWLVGWLVGWDDWFGMVD